MPCVHVATPLTTGFIDPQYQLPELLTNTSPELHVGSTHDFDCTELSGNCIPPLLIFTAPVAAKAKAVRYSQTVNVIVAIKRVRISPPIQGCLFRIDKLRANNV
jgi:hypothetical protein